MNAQTIYLDHAATTALHPEVLETMLPYLAGNYGNPSSVHGAGRAARMAVEQARREIAVLLHANPSEILFTSGGTESNHISFIAVVRDLGCRHLITSPIENHAVLHPFENYSLQTGVTSSMVAITKEGKIDYQDLKKQLYHFTGVGRKCFVSLMGANNETGEILDINRVGELCKMFGAIFHSDGVQLVGHYPVNVNEMDLHFLSASGHKFGGPKGVGILYVREGIGIEPLIFGGGQERGRRAGIENVAGIVGFAKALQVAMRDFEVNARYIKGLKKSLANHLKETVEGVSFNGLPDEGLYTVLSVNFLKNEYTSSLVTELDKRGIFVSPGSACSMGAESHVMRELGKQERHVTVRFSFSANNTIEEVERTAAVVKELLQEVLVVN